jgi:putative glycosyltransferase (TIGR04348 family)
MRVFMACPAPRGSHKGNRVTAERWARVLRGLGHRVVIGQEYAGQACDVLVALHARRSFPAVRAYRQAYPRGALVVALTGTDLYRDIRTSRRAQQALRLADRIVVLQRRGPDELPAALRRKAQVIYQSAEPTRVRRRRPRGTFDVCVLGHLRREKDPFRAALALRLLPRPRPFRVVQAGAALSPAMAARARALQKQDLRYRWVGEVSAGRARRILAQSSVLVLSSRMEGGANVISEALADGVPVIASRIPGSEGILGERYPGLFPVGDTQALADLLYRTEADGDFHRRLLTWCERLRPLVDPARERRAWQRLLAELVTREKPSTE